MSLSNTNGASRLSFLTQIHMFTDSQICGLASELNHLFWTTDTPTPDERLAEEVRQNRGQIVVVGENMQCAAHAIVSAGLMCRQGDTVTTRAGSAIVVDSRRPEPHLILKHWWISVSSGLFDLSLNLSGYSNHRPVIFRNTNLVDSGWRIGFKDDFKRIRDDAWRCHADGDCGVFYQTDKKRLVSKEEVEADLLNHFRPAKDKGVTLSYLEIVLYCERFLAGGESLLGMTQEAAWRHLTGQS